MYVQVCASPGITVCRLFANLQTLLLVALRLASNFVLATLHPPDIGLHRAIR